MRRTGWRKAKDLSGRMEWLHTGEPQVLTWTVKAIDRSILVWACLFALPIFFLLCLGGFFWIKGGSFMSSVVIAPLLMFLFLFKKVGMEKTVFVYRATPQRLEIRQWQDIPDLVFTFLRVVPFFVIGIILMALISNPALSIAALAGPALVGILIASVGGDSDYKAIYKRFRQEDIVWSEVHKILLDERKGLVALSVDWENKVIDPGEVDFSNPDHHIHLYPVYFQKHQEIDVLTLFKDRTKNAEPIVEGSYRYPFST